jgi:uncharacterized protein DUF3551
MHKPMSMILLALTAGFTAIAGSGSAAAVEYPYCIQGGGWGIPGQCLYRSYEQCLASASGRHVYCGLNPRFAWDRRTRQGRPY